MGALELWPQLDLQAEEVEFHRKQQLHQFPELTLHLQCSVLHPCRNLSLPPATTQIIFENKQAAVYRVPTLSKTSTAQEPYET
jgi:hypothetical protein